MGAASVIFWPGRHGGSAVARFSPGEQTDGSISLRRLEFGADRLSGRKRLSGERVERRLTAILAADVAGYSRLMGLDEGGTLQRLRSHLRDLIASRLAGN